MKIKKEIFIGIFIGFIITVISIFMLGTNVYAKINKDYKDDIISIIDFVEESKDPVLQMDYIIAGLTLSADFQTYLEEGVEKGLWTEEYLTQVVTDDLLPIYYNQYKGTFEMLKETEEYKKIQSIINKIKEALDKMDLDAVKANIIKLRDLILSLDISKIILIVNSLKEQIPELKLVINKLIQNKDKLKEIIDNLFSMKEEIIEKIKKLETILNKISSELTFDKIKEYIISLLQNNEQITEIIIKLKEYIKNIKDKLTDLNLTITEILNKILEDVDTPADGDFDFYTIADANGQVSIGKYKIDAKILNALDIEIIGYELDNNGTPFNFSDDILYLGQISIGFESIGEKLYLGTTGYEIKGTSATFINGLIPKINEQI